MSDPGNSVDEEVRAFEAVLTALISLDDETRRRVLAYVRLRFGGEDATAGIQVAERVPEGETVSEIRTATDISDIRTLKDEKQPKSAVEMAVLVAYYVTELAPQPERKSTIGTADINKYFKQAGFRLPTQPNVTLHRAKNAGYLDTSARGEYSINPVGFNLVAHGLPRPAGGGRKAQPKSRRKVSKKTTGAKTATRAKKPTASSKTTNRKKR